MTTIMSYTKVASLLYNANTSLIRFLYVRSSLQADVQEVYSRNQFTLTFVAIGEGLNIINLTSCIYYRKVHTGILGFLILFIFRTKSSLPLILYQACLDPWEVFSIPFYLVMPINQLIIYTIDVVIISNNIFLSRFLYQQTSHNSGQVISEWTDRQY